MKFSFPKKDIEVHEPELSTEEKLDEALKEIECLTEKLPVPIKESKKELKRRYGILTDNLKQRYEDSIKEAKDAYEEGLKVKAEYEELKSKEEKLVFSLEMQDGEREQKLAELEQEFETKKRALDEEYAAKIQELDELEAKKEAEFDAKREEEEKGWEQERRKIEAERITAEAMQETARRNFNIEMVNVRHDGEVAARELKEAAEKTIETQRVNWEKERTESLKSLEEQRNSTLEEIKTFRESAEREITDRKSQLENEYTELKASFEKEMTEKRAELSNEVDKAHEEIEVKRNELEAESKAILDKIEEDKKILASFEKNIDAKTAINKTLNKKLAKKISLIALVLIVIGSFCLFNFRYSLFPVSNIKNSINSSLSNDYREIRGNIVLTVNGEAMTKLNIVNGVNSLRSEEIFGLQIRDDRNNFEWERYNKGDAEFIKTPLEPQYVLATNRSDAGWYYNVSDSQSLEKTILYGILSSIDVTETNVISEYTNDNILKNFGIFIKNRFSPDHVTHDFTINADVLNSVYGTLAASPGYKAFIDEEGYITKQLKLSNSFEDIDNLLMEISTSVLSEGTGKIQIENGLANSLSLNFKGVNTSGENIGIYCSVSFISKDKDTTYDNSRYLMNSMKYDEIYPRIEQEEFEDLESQGQLQENVSTVKALEDEGYEIVDN